MATNPYKISDAINQVVETIIEFPRATAGRPSNESPADVTSVYYRAEVAIDRSTAQILAQGWPENTERAKKFTAGTVNSVNNRINMVGVLSCKSAGPDQHRTLVIRNALLYDGNAGTFDFAATSSVYLDAVMTLLWEDLPLKLADLVIANAAMLFQRRMQGSQQNDQHQQQEYIAAELRADRNEAKKGDLPPNLRPIFPTGGSAGGGGGGGGGGEGDGN